MRTLILFIAVLFSFNFTSAEEVPQDTSWSNNRPFQVGNTLGQTKIADVAFFNNKEMITSVDQGVFIRKTSETGIFGWNHYNQGFYAAGLGGIAVSQDSIVISKYTMYDSGNLSGGNLIFYPDNYSFKSMLRPVKYSRDVIKGDDNLWYRIQPHPSDSVEPGVTVVGETGNISSFQVMDTVGTPVQIRDIIHYPHRDWVLVGTDNGAYAYAADVVSKQREYHSLVNDTVRDISISMDGSVYFSHPHSISILRKDQTWDTLTAGEELPQAEINKIACGHRYLWVATQDTGIVRLDEQGSQGIEVFHKNNSPLEYNSFSLIHYRNTSHGVEVRVGSQDEYKKFTWRYDEPEVRVDSVVRECGSDDVVFHLSSDTSFYGRYSLDTNQTMMWSHDSSTTIGSGVLTRNIGNFAEAGDTVTTRLQLELGDGMWFTVNQPKDLVVKDGCDTVSTAVTDLQEPTGELKVYPNPAVAEQRVTFDSPLGGKLAIYSVDGRLVEKKQVEKGQNSLTIDQPGMYICRVTNGKETRTTKLVLRE